MTHKAIEGMNPQQMDRFLQNGSVNRYQYKFKAKDIFDESGDSPILTKQSFLKLYQTWDNVEKEQIEIYLTLVKNDVRIKTEKELGKDRGGYYSVFCASNNAETYQFKIYGSIDFLGLINVSYFDGAYNKPDFTLEELYQEALKTN